MDPFSPTSAEILGFLQHLIDYLKNSSSNAVLSLEQFSSKLATLLALVTAHRVQTLSLIRLSSIKFDPSGVQINITDPIKTSIRTGIYPSFTFQYFTEDPALCVVSTLQEYVRLTDNIRKGEDILFLSTRKPHGHASSTTIARWIRTTLQKAGIDTQIYGAHSTRHATTSAALRSGVIVSVEDIRKLAGWTGRSTVFEKFYNRPLSTQSVIPRVLLRTN